LTERDQIIDLFGGQADLEVGLIRPVSPSVIENDPLRALRAVRQAGQFGFLMDGALEGLIRRDGARLAAVSGERVRDELSKILALEEAAPRLRQMDELGLLTTIFPELETLRGISQSPPHHLGVLAHSLSTVEALESTVRALAARDKLTTGDQAPGPLDPLLPFAARIAEHLSLPASDRRIRLLMLKLTALLHDLGKPRTRTVQQDGRIRFLDHAPVGAEMVATALRRLRFSNLEVRYAETVVRNHLRPLLLASQDSVSRRAVYRFFRDARDTGVDVLLHALADHQATYAPGSGQDSLSGLVSLAARMMADYWTRQSSTVRPPKLIDGRDLLSEFGLEPGPAIGVALELVREAQVAGEVDSKEMALELVRRWLGSEGS
jgi:poly(A) polymerase/tRNA nucleotidyltransferase (CCA-adding enzyme)